jgi:hypothetical protein
VAGRKVKVFPLNVFEKTVIFGEKWKYVLFLRRITIELCGSGIEARSKMFQPWFRWCPLPGLDVVIESIRGIRDIREDEAAR